jgi:hypothetical protein
MPPKRTDTRGAIQPAGSCSNKNEIDSEEEEEMGMLMVKCPQTGHAIPTGIATDRERFRCSTVFFGRTRCPICSVDHAWFAQEAWASRPSARGVAAQVFRPDRRTPSL